MSHLTGTVHDAHSIPIARTQLQCNESIVRMLGCETVVLNNNIKLVDCAKFTKEGQRFVATAGIFAQTENENSVNRLFCFTSFLCACKHCIPPHVVPVPVLVLEPVPVLVLVPPTWGKARRMCASARLSGPGEIAGAGAGADAGAGAGAGAGGNCSDSCSSSIEKADADAAAGCTASGAVAVAALVAALVVAALVARPVGILLVIRSSRNCE